MSLTAVRLLLSILGGSAGMTMKYLDVTTPFLESKVSKELYVTLRMGVVLHKGLLRVDSGSQGHAKLLKGLYGLTQVSLNWFETLDNFLTSTGMPRLKTEPGIYVLKCGTDNQNMKALQA